MANTNKAANEVTVFPHGSVVRGQRASGVQSTCGVRLALHLTGGGYGD